LITRIADATDIGPIALEDDLVAGSAARVIAEELGNVELDVVDAKQCDRRNAKLVADANCHISIARRRWQIRNVVISRRPPQHERRGTEREHDDS
jgi:hypothetical protein